MTVVAVPNMGGLMLLASKKLFTGCIRKGLKTSGWTGRAALLLQMLLQELLQLRV